MIDTELWSFALKKPSRKFYRTDLEYNEALKIHQNSNSFLKKIIHNENYQIYFTNHQLSELFHVLSFRGNKLPIKDSVKFIKNLILLKNISIIINSFKDFLESMNLSMQSKIHIWDFLCVVPLKDYLNEIYTVDRHFQHDIFKRFNFKIKNPIEYWLTF